MTTDKQENTKKYTSQPSESKIRFFLATFLIPLVVFSIGVFPLIFWLAIIYLMYIITLNIVLYLILTPIIIILSILILIVSEVLISGAIIQLFNITYKEGTYEYSVNNNMVFKWMLVYQLYTPIRKILDIVPMRHINIVYLRLLGLKIGENSLLGGVIRDPCLTEIGDNVTMGGYAILYCHIHNKAERTITFKKIKIGDNCIIGAGTIIMPGVIMENNSILAAGGVTTKNSLLQENKIYGGNPAKEIRAPKKNKKQ
jgi:acetyltransferase-like isoleucine patch superfamily enzyme